MINDVRLPAGAWVVVADYSRAIILSNTGTPASPELTVIQMLEAETNPMTHSLGSDRPGRVFAGSHRSAVEAADLHDTNGQKFIQHVAKELEKAHSQAHPDALVLVAPPKALAVLRQTISEPIKALIVAEICKDLTNMPVKKIAEHFS